MSPENDVETNEEMQKTAVDADRVRRDQISKLMADYLLKGYKMLATYCPKCSTILFQDRDGVDHCFACEIVDRAPAAATDGSSQSLATNGPRAASEGVGDSSSSHQPAVRPGPEVDNDTTATDRTPLTEAVADGGQSAASNISENPVAFARKAVLATMRSATMQLQRTSRHSVTIDCLNRIKAAAETLIVLKKAS